MSTIALIRPTSRRIPLVSTFLLSMDVWRERQALKRLDDAALEDLGLTRADADREAGYGLTHLPIMRG